MQDKPSGAGNVRAATPALLDEDDSTQAAVLRGVLSTYPEPITLAELIRAMTFGSTEFSDLDRIERAVRDLIAGGLLYRRDDDLVIPTRAAAKFYDLFEL
jgi:hypothetical protein